MRAVVGVVGNAEESKPEPILSYSQYMREYESLTIKKGILLSECMRVGE
jgi:hypothetical protein